MAYIKLEPHKIFRHAITRTTKAGKITYSENKLRHILMLHHEWDHETADEWLNYNIYGLVHTSTFSIETKTNEILTSTALLDIVNYSDNDKSN
jgi:hypothetical protein